MNLLKKLSVMGLVAVFSFAMVGMAMAENASDYSTQADCSDAGYYWYDGTETCYETENAKLSAQVSNLMDRIDDLTATIAELSGGEGTEEPATGGDVPAECEGVEFDRSLTTGMSGDDVLCLQTMLNQDLDEPIADSGPGSPGSETDYFGSITEAGVVTFQEKYSEDVLAPYDFSQGTGYVGKTTKAKLNELLDDWAAAEEEEEAADYGTAGEVTVTSDIDQFSGLSFDLVDEDDDALCQVSMAASEDLSASEGASDLADEIDISCSDFSASADGDVVTVESDTTFGFANVGDYLSAEITEAADEEEEEEAKAGLSVELSDDTTISQSVPKKGQHIPFLKVDFTANDKDVEVSSVTFDRTGIGSKNDFDKLWLEDEDGKILTNGKTVTSDDEVSFNYLNDTIEEGNTKTYTLVADLGGSNGNLNAFQISSSDAIDSDADELSGSFPITGNQMSLTSYSIGTTTFEKVGSGTTTVAVGDQEITVGEFKLSPSSNNSNDFVFKSVRLKEYKSASLSDLDNIALHDQEGTKLAEGTTDGNYVSFSGLGYDIEDGNTKRFELRADVVDGTDGDIFKFKLNKAYDLFVEEDVGYGSKIGNATNLAAYEINAGSFSIKEHSSQPSNDDYNPDTNNIVGLVGEMDLDQQVTVSGVDVYLHSDTTKKSDNTAIDADIENVSLYKGGTLIDQLSSVDSSGDYYNFANTFTLSDGEEIKVEFDTKSGATGGRDYKFKISAGDFKTPEYTESGDSVASADITGTVNGRKVSITDSAITANRNDGFADGHAIVQGATGVTMMKYVLEAGVSSDIEINKLDVDLSNAGDSSYYTSVKMMAGDTQLGSIKDVGSDSNVTFSNLSYDIPASEVQQFSIVADVDSSASTTNNLYFVLDMSDSLFYDGSGNEAGSVSGNATSAKLNVTSGGNLNISADAEPESDALAATENNDALGSWTFTAQDDTITLKELYFANDVNSTATTSTSTWDSLIKSLKLYVDGEAVKTGKLITSGDVHFSLGADEQFTVGSTNPVDVTLKADFNSISATSSTNKQGRLGLFSVVADSSSGSELGLSNISGVGTTTSTYSTSTAASSSRANEFVVAKSRPLLSSNASAIGSSLSNGTQKVYAFDVTAPDAGAVSFKKVALDIQGVASTSDVDWTTDAGSSAIYRGTTEKTASYSTSSNSITITFNSVQTVSAGNTVTYKYEASLSNFNDSNDYLETRIKSGASNYVTNKNYTNQSGGGNFIWSDNSGTYESETSKHWMTEYLFNELPLNRVRLDK